MNGIPISWASHWLSYLWRLEQSECRTQGTAAQADLRLSYVRSQSRTHYTSTADRHSQWSSHYHFKWWWSNGHQYTSQWMIWNIGGHPCQSFKAGQAGYSWAASTKIHKSLVMNQSWDDLAIVGGMLIPLVSIWSVSLSCRLLSIMPILQYFASRRWHVPW